jgi:hypothetical protein
MKKDWTSIIAEQKASGENVSRYCRAKGLNKSLFYYHQKRQTFLPDTGFIRVETGLVDTTGIEIIYPNGVRLKLSGKVPVSQISRLVHV